MAQTRFTIHAAKFGTTVLPGVTGQAVPLEEQAQIAAGAGDLYPRGHFITGVSIPLSLSSRALATVLGKCELSTVTPQINLADTGKALGLAFAKQQTKGDGYFAAGNHQTWLFEAGLLALQRLAAADADTVIAELMGYPVSDAPEAVATPPYTLDETGDLETLPTSREIYRVSSIVVGGTTLDRYGAWSLDFGAPIQPLKRPSDYWDRDVIIGGAAGLIEPVLSIPTEQIDEVVSQAGGVGAEVTAVITIKELARDGSFGTGQVVVTVRGTLMPAKPSGQAQSPAEDTMTIRGRYDGTNLPVTIVVT